MTLHISPYLLPYLKLADQLPDQLPDVPEAVVQALQARIRKLVELVANRDVQIERLISKDFPGEPFEKRVDIVTK